MATSLLFLAALLPAAAQGTPTVIGWELEVVSAQQDSITLRWIVPSEDQGYNAPLSYDLRYRAGIAPPGGWMWDDTEWDAAESVIVANLPAADPTHATETVIVSGLAPGTPYYFGLKIHMVGETVIAFAEVEMSTLPPDTTAPSVPLLLDLEPDGAGFRIRWEAASDDAGNPASGGVPSNTVAWVEQGAGLALNAATFTGPDHRELGASGAPGAVEVRRIGGLKALTAYDVAIRAGDEAGNPGGISQVLSVLTGEDPVSHGKSSKGCSARFGSGLLVVLALAAMSATMAARCAALPDA